MSVCVRMSTCMHVAHRGLHRVSDLLLLEILAVVSCLMLVLGTRLLSHLSRPVFVLRQHLVCNSRTGWSGTHCVDHLELTDLPLLP